MSTLIPVQLGRRKSLPHNPESATQRLKPVVQISGEFGGFDDDDGDVVGLGGAFGEGGDAFLDGVVDGEAGFGGVGGGDFAEAFFAEEFACVVLCLGDAVAVDDNFV